MELHNDSRMFGLDLSEFEEIRRAFALKTYGPHEVVFREGEASDVFCYIQSGQVLVSKRNRHGDEEPLSVLKAGQFFGEIGLVEEMPRTATVTAIIDVELLQLDRERFQHLLRTNAPFSTLMTTISRSRLLRQTAMFRDLDDKTLLTITEHLTEKVCPQETVLFQEDDPPDALYIIIEGGVRVSKRTKSGRDVTLVHLGQGDVFGEMGIIDAQPRSATVVTTEPSKLLVLPREDFQSVLRGNPLISFNTVKVLSQRLRDKDRDTALAKGTSFFKGMTIIARPEKCLSCKTCEIACAVSKSRTRTLHGAIYEEPLPVKRIHVRKTLIGSEPVMRPEHCFHCRNAPCLTSCKLDAIKRDLISETIVISEEKCKGCGLCAKACPFNVITVIRCEGKKRVVLKCTHCAEHQSGPACVRSCPTNALVISLGTMPVT